MSEMRFKHRWLTFAISLLLGLPLLMVGGGRILGLDRHLVQPRAATAPRVAIIHWPTAPTDEDVETMVRQGLELALGPSGMGAVVAPGDLVLLKPNLGLGLDAHEISSWQVLRAVAETCREAGASRVIVAESPSEGYDHYVRAGYVSHVEGVEFYDLGDPRTTLVPVMPEGSLWPEDDALVMPQVYVGADVVITIPKMKTHSSAGYTGALKNALGVPPLASYRSNPGLGWRDLFHDQYGIHLTIPQVNLCRPPDLAIVDAVLSGEGAGPWGADPVATNMILVARDPVAVDAVGAALMGLDPERIRHLVNASAVELGCADLARIEIVGGDLVALQRLFVLPGDRATLYRRATVIGAPPLALALDGEIDEWPARAMARLEGSRDVRQGEGAWDGPQDASLRAWAAWDDHMLYLAADVWDETLLPNTRLPSACWDGDGVEWFVSGADQDEPGRSTAYTGLDHRLCLAYGQDALMDVRRGRAIGDAVVARRPFSGGYSVEVALPFSALGFRPGHNLEIGLDVGLNDTDTGGHRQTRLMWGGTDALDWNVCEMGVALLRRSTPVVPATPTPTVTATATLEPTPTGTLTPSPTQTTTTAPTVLPLTPTSRPGHLWLPLAFSP